MICLPVVWMLGIDRKTWVAAYAQERSRKYAAQHLKDVDAQLIHRRSKVVIGPCIEYS